MEIVASILSSVITGGLALIGVVYSNRATGDEVQARLDKQQAVMDTKLEELTREVRAHNHFAERIPIISEQIKVANHRIEDLESKTGHLESLHMKPTE